MMEYNNLINSAKELKSKTSYHGGILKIKIVNDETLHYVKYSNEPDHEKDEEGFTLVPKEVFLTVLYTLYF